jgi:ribonuclease Z
MVDVCLPGTGGMIPLWNRWLACCLIEYQGRTILIDCGEGTQIALKKTGWRPRLDILLITHFHADHIAGLPGLLLSLGNSEKTTPLDIFGPPGLEKVLSAMKIIAPVVPFQITVNECDGAGMTGKGEMLISYLPLSHGVPCLGYSVTVTRKPVFNPQKAEALKIPKTLYKILHSGKNVCHDGREITPEMVIDSERRPLKVCYFTDTQPVRGMADFAANADLLISEGMYGEDEMRDKMLAKGHMVFSDSAKIAKEANVRRLWLTHYGPKMISPDKYIHSARSIFPETETAYDGIRTTLR